MSQRFIKLIDSEESQWLQDKHPTAFLLLTTIARRARRTKDHPDGLQPGDALIGDYKATGLTRKQYRNSLEKLVHLGYIEILLKCKNSSNIEKRAIKKAIRGTLVNLANSKIYDINIEDEGHQEGQRGAIKGPSKGHEQERRKNEERKKKKKTQSLGKIYFDRSLQNFVGITEVHMKLWIEAYPSLDIKAELAKMKLWLLQPEKITWIGNQQFIDNWLKKGTSYDKQILKKSPEQYQSSEPRFKGRAPIFPITGS